MERSLEKGTYGYLPVKQDMQMGILVVADHNGRIIKWNRSAERAFGYQSEVIMGKPLSILMAEAYCKPFPDFLTSIYRLKRKQQRKLLELPCVDCAGRVFRVEFVLGKWRLGQKDLYVIKMVEIPGADRFGKEEEKNQQRYGYKQVGLRFVRQMVRRLNRSARVARGSEMGARFFKKLCKSI